MHHYRRARIKGPLLAAATMVGKHAEYAVRLVLLHASDSVLEAEHAAALAGVLDDIGGLVGILRRRARMLGVTLRINPDACACG